MKITMLISTHKLKDTRIYWKESRSLAELGYNIQILAMSNEDVPEPEANIKWITIPKNKNRFFRFLNSYKLLIKAIKNKSDVYQINEGEILWFSPILKILSPGSKVVYDAHEPLGIFISYKNWVPRILRGFVKIIVDLYERFFTYFCDAVIAVAPKNRQKFQRWHRKAYLVRNFPIETADITPVDWHKRKKIFLYIGLISIHRGFEQILEFANLLSQSNEQDYRIKIIGMFSPDHKKIIENLVSQMPSDISELSTDWVDHKTVLKEIEQARFGFSLFDETIIPHVKFTTTNKIFEYMLHGAIPIVTYVPELEEYIKNFENGILLPLGEEANKLFKLLPEIEKNGEIISSNARKYAKSHFLWKFEKERYISLFEEL